MTHAVIFDMDGVLVDSYDAHLQSWLRLAEEIKAPFTPADFAATFGQTSREIIQRFWGKMATSPDRVAELDQRKEALYRELIAKDFPAMKGAAELIDSLAESGFRLAVGSSGPPENVELALDRLGKTDRFDAIVTGRDVTRGKPDPQVFLLAAERLAVAPEHCVVIEDAPAGIHAAQTAGMKSIALLSKGRKREDFASHPPNRFASSLDELEPATFRALLATQET